MKRSRSTRGQSRPRFPGDDAVFPSFFFLSFFFFDFSRGTWVQGDASLREIFSDLDFSDYNIF